MTLLRLTLCLASLFAPMHGFGAWIQDSKSGEADEVPDHQQHLGGDRGFRSPSQYALPSAPFSGQPGPRLTATRALEIGLADQPLTAPVGILVDRSGGAIILDRSPPFLHFVDRSGRHTTARIRQGAGPGELQQPVRIGSVGDSVWVYDAAQSRISLFSRHGAFLTSRAPPRIALPGIALADPIAIVGQGRAVFIGMVPDEALGSGPVSIPIVAVEAGSAGSRTIATLPLTRRNVEVTVLAGGGVGRAFLPQPFGDDPLWSMSRDGETLVLVDRRVPRVGFGASYDVILLRTSGDTLGKFVVPYQAKPLTNHEYNRVIAELTTPRRLSDGREITIEEAQLRPLLFRPGLLPPVSAVDAGDDGTIWLRTTFPVFGDDPEYTVVDRAGRRIGQVAVPLRGRNRLMGVSRRMLWFATETIEGVPVVVSYLIQQ